MSLKFERTTSDKKYELHPAGSYPAICRDCYLSVRKHPFAGQKNKYDKINPDEEKRVVIEFLTSEMVEVDGQKRNAFASIRLNPAIGEKSALFQFLSSWFPELGSDHITKCFYGDDGLSLDGLVVGKPAMVTIRHRKDTSDPNKVWADVSGAIPVPNIEAMNAMVPAIPADYQRKPSIVRKDEAPKTADEAGADSIRNGDSEII